LTGDSQPSLDDTLDHYDIFDQNLNFPEKYVSKFKVTMGGVVTSKPGNEVYIAATSENLAQKHLDKGTQIYGEGRIIGAPGL